MAKLNTKISCMAADAAAMAVSAVELTAEQALVCLSALSNYMSYLKERKDVKDEFKAQVAELETVLGHVLCGMEVGAE